MAECLLTLKRFYEAERSAAALTTDPFRPFAPISPVRTDNMKPFPSLSPAHERLSPLSRPPMLANAARPSATGPVTPDINYDAMASNFFPEGAGVLLLCLVQCPQGCNGFKFCHS